MLLIPLLALLLTSCAETPTPKPFPPPEGYSSWDEYYRESQQQPASTPIPSPTPTPIPTPSPSPTPTATSPSQTFQPIVITGSGTKTSPPFKITTEEWIVNWSYTSDDPEFAVFSFFIFPRGELTIFVESVMFPEGTSGSTYSYAGPGEYYIKIAAANIKSWTITIKPP